VVALQFHLEVNPELVRNLVDNCRDDLEDGTHIQTEKDILSEQSFFESNQQVIYQFLDYLSSLIS